MSLDVIWAIRDCRTLNAQEKALLFAIESRGVHYGTWETVAADAGMKKDGYYRWRGELEAKGVLSVTERPGKTTVHQVNAAWFDNETLAGIQNEVSGKPGNTLPEIQNDPSGISVMKGIYEGDHVSGPLKATTLPLRNERLVRAGDIPWDEPEWTEQDCAPLNAWDRVALERAGAHST
ncbi:hypothetical protein [Nocardioides sp. InS609-2]|uniref:hypothetical protein n=1 Tax=Nocardioides sp. InS609-2 TaxID=2760705 RepID=UPI0020BE899E|nr:hypothetical protein [Nocardioides sp. InS609-2]